MSIPDQLRIATSCEAKRLKKHKQWIATAISQILVTLMGVLFILPFLWMVSTSLKPDSSLFDLPPKWIPTQFLWSNYPKALGTIPFARYSLNSVFIAITTTAGTVFSSALVGYSFARLRWRGKGFFFVILLSTMMIPSQVTLIPLYMTYVKLRWINTYLPLIIPAFFGSAFAIFLLKQFFQGVPKDLSESAKIDGCNEAGIFLRIILPLCKPALASVAIFAFVFAWNDFMGPLIYINDSKLYTLSIGLRAFQQRYTTQWNYLMAASVVSILPMLAIFFSFQKYFIEGIALSGLKG